MPHNKKQRSKEEWKELIRQLRASGLSITTFCKQNNISKSSLSYWLHMISDKIDTNDGKAISFASAVIQDKAIPMDNTANLYGVQISLPSGISIKLPINYEASLLINLVKGLQSC